MQEASSFEKPSILESDIEKIKSQVEARVNSPDAVPMPRPEIVKEAVKSVESADDSVLPDYAKDSPEETKIEAEHLFEVAIKEGLGEANKLAKKAHPSVADMFHDAMAKHYMELEKKGLIQ